MNEKVVNTFIVVWDMTGLETVIDVADLISEDVMKRLRDEKGSTLGQTMFILTQRAKANSHRHYEIYSVQANPDITKEMIAEMFKNDPQGSADLIRERGTKIYSDRIGKVQVIT